MEPSGMSGHSSISALLPDRAITIGAGAAEMRIDRCLVDANWGQMTDLVYQFCRQSKFASLLMPSHGKYVGAASMPFSEYRRTKGERIGLNWRIPLVAGKRAVRFSYASSEENIRVAARRLGEYLGKS